MSFSSSPSSWSTRSFAFGDTGLPKQQRPPTPSVRQESVIENVEKKQRENLKSRLKLLSTLPSRSASRASVGAGLSPMPVIVREPPARVSLPKTVPSSSSSSSPRLYTSVLTSSDQQQLLDAGPKSRLVRRHSVGSLVYQCRKERSSSESNGNGLKKDDVKSRSSFHIARYDSSFNVPESSFSTDRNNMGGTSSKTAARIVRDDLGSTWPKAAPESGKNRQANGSSYPQNSNFEFDRLPKTSPASYTNDADRPEGKSHMLINFENDSTRKHEAKENEAGKGYIGNLTNGDKYGNKYKRNDGEIEYLDDVFNATNNFCHLDLKKDARNELKTPPHDPTTFQQVTNGVLQPSETPASPQTNREESTELISLDLPHAGTVGELFSDFNAPLFTSKDVKLGSEGVLAQIELIHWDDMEPSGKSETYASLEPGSGGSKAKMNDFEATKQNNNKGLDKNNEKIQKHNELFDIVTSAVSTAPDYHSANTVVEPPESAVATLIDLEVSGSYEKTSHDDPVNELPPASGGGNCRSGKSLEIVINKSRDSGLGFCIEGGMGHPDGDKPITVKRVFAEHPSAPKHLKVGDELCVVAKEDMTFMSHISAWKFLRTLPDGDVSMTILRHSS